MTCIANTETALHTENAPCAACHSNGHAAAAPRAGATSQSSMHSNPLALSCILVLSRSSCSADARLSYQPTKRPAAVLRRAMTHTHMQTAAGRTQPPTLHVAYYCRRAYAGCPENTNGQKLPNRRYKINHPGTQATQVRTKQHIVRAKRHIANSNTKGALHSNHANRCCEPGTDTTQLAAETVPSRHAVGCSARSSSTLLQLLLDPLRNKHTSADKRTTTP